MPSPHVSIPGPPADVREALAALQARLELTAEFPADVTADAERAAALPPSRTHVDRTGIELVTIDPASSMDLDQAVQIERAGSGFLVRYAISDVGHFVRPGSALDAETHRRGQTMYAPGARIPLHPPVLSEGAASLLADGRPRPSMLWELRLDAVGELTDVALTRALVLSRAKLSYESVQADLDAGTPLPRFELVPEVGRLRRVREIERGGVSLNLPEQEIVEEPDGRWALEFRDVVPVEEYNAQISLLTGMAAARVMLDAKVGILRTLPPAGDDEVGSLRRRVNALGVEWPRSVSYPDFVRSLSPNRPRELAALTCCTSLFRGAGYVAFDGALPDGNHLHSALAAPYAHTTAPLRRLIDRYVLEICHSELGGTPVPDWARAALAELPGEMAASDRTAASYERGVMDLAEALVLRDRVGERFPAVVTDVNPKNGQATVQVADPAVELRVQTEESKPGSEVFIRIVEVDLHEGRVDISVDA